MKFYLMDNNQKQIGFWEKINSKDIDNILINLPSSEDFTLEIEHEIGTLMYISFDKGRYTLFVKLGDDEFYDYISSTVHRHNTEFIQGGQKVILNTKYLASFSDVEEAIKKFYNNPAYIRKDSNWERQK